MNRFGRWLLLMLFCAGAALALASTCGRGAAVTAAAAPPREPLLEVADAEKALQMAGFEQAWVYRWRGGFLEGHVLDTERRDERAVITTEDTARNAYKLAAAMGDDAAAKAPFDPAQVSGMIIFAIRPKKVDAADHESIRAITVRVERAGKSAELGTGPITGRLPAYKSVVRGAQLGKLTLAGNVQRDLFDLRVRSNLAPVK
jgi:hypothetical protein